MVSPMDKIAYLESKILELEKEKTRLELILKDWRNTFEEALDLEDDEEMHTPDYMFDVLLELKDLSKY